MKDSEHIGPYLYRMGKTQGNYDLYLFWCPGCKREHPFTVARNDCPPPEHNWTFDGNAEAPTFAPSLLCDKDYPQHRCHSFVERGMIRFLDDCHHDLKGQIVPLPIFSEHSEYGKQ